ncbi:MAG: FHA domain-containing protein [Bacteroidia bacterium]
MKKASKSILLGRSQECDILLDHPEVSAKHAILILTVTGTYEIQDLGSTNGTFVNGQRIEGRVEIHPGDKVVLGSYEIPWQEYFEKDIPAKGLGSDSPTRATKYGHSGQNAKRTLLWIGIVLVILSIGLYLFYKYVMDPSLKTS